MLLLLGVILGWNPIAILRCGVVFSAQASFSPSEVFICASIIFLLFSDGPPREKKDTNSAWDTEDEESSTQRSIYPPSVDFHAKKFAHFPDPTRLFSARSSLEAGTKG